MKINNCCLCESESIYFSKTLSCSALANNLEIKPNSFSHHKIFELGLAICNSCDHVQLASTVDPKILFSNYSYRTSVSTLFKIHFEEYAESVNSEFANRNTKSVLDVGCNDGFLLDCFKKYGWLTYGVDPADNLLESVKDKHNVISTYFDSSVIKLLPEVGFDVITANNVFAHSRNLIEFAKTAASLLKTNGSFIFEVQYLVDMLKDDLFDMIYHEHTSYHHVHPLLDFLERAGLTVIRIKHISTHGGSIRVYCKKSIDVDKSRIDKSVANFMSAEKKLTGLHLRSAINDFIARTTTTFREINSFILSAQSQGFRICGYTAPAKATTLLSGISEEAKSCIEFVVDDSALKSGKYIPGTDCMIVGHQALEEFINSNQSNSLKTIIIIFAWNMAEKVYSEVMAKSKPNLDGVKFYRLLPSITHLN